jgi:hypothetical protein
MSPRRTSSGVFPTAIWLPVRARFGSKADIQLLPECVLSDAAHFGALNEWAALPNAKNP